MRKISFGLLTVLLALTASRALAQAPAAAAAPTTTFWSYLGIPQAWNACKDSHLNRLGRHPEKEQQPPLKRIADPENLKSPNPAIQVAAEAKADADLAPQKIKAIEYLATVGCCCPKDKEEVSASLLASLSDCSESVRFAAAMAFCKLAGEPCGTCQPCTCCRPEVMTKLYELANLKDPNGCYLEPSPRVRAAAENALAGCQRAVGARGPAGPTPTVPSETPREQRVPTPAPPAPKPYASQSSHDLQKVRFAEVNSLHIR
jgi:hypothetical protein